MNTLWIVLGTLFALAVIAIPVIRAIGAKHTVGEAVGWLDIALALAQGIDDAKEQLDPVAKHSMSAALKGAAEKAGKHGDVEAFLAKFAFNQKQP